MVFDAMGESINCKVNLRRTSMKILGVSLGTKNGNNDTMCRVALEAAKAKRCRDRIYPPS